MWFQSAPRVRGETNRRTPDARETDRFQSAPRVRGETSQLIPPTVCNTRFNPRPACGAKRACLEALENGHNVFQSAPRVRGETRLT